MKLHKVLNVLIALVSIVIIVGINTFAHICKAMGPMGGPCATTKKYALVVSIVLLIVAVGQILLNKKVINAVLSLATAVLGVVLILLPGVIAPVCKMKTMHCYVATRPLLIISGIVTIVLVVVNALVLFQSYKTRASISGE